MTSMYALGWTQHSKGSQNIRCMAMLQLILGNIGVRGGGMNALRGHSNIQGLTDIGLMSNLIPGYLTLPPTRSRTSPPTCGKRGFKPVRPDQMSYWQNYKKFFVSFQKAMWGAAATAENDWAYRLPAQARRAGLRRPARLRADAPGQDERLLLPGLQPAAVASRTAARCRRRCPSSSSWSSWIRWRPRRRGSGRTTASTTRPSPRRSRPRSSSCRPPASPRTRARSPTPGAGCSGTGPAARLRARPSPTSGSWRSSICG